MTKYGFASLSLYKLIEYPIMNIRLPETVNPPRRTIGFERRTSNIEHPTSNVEY